MFYFIKSLIFLSFILISSRAHALPSDMKLLSDIAYGKHADQVLDVYIPANAKDAPVIFMVHGGGWRGGDKADRGDVENKVAHWGAKGFIIIFTNYRLLPEMDPFGQAKDVEAALRFSQKRAGEWGGSSEKFILMGHSSGAHLASLAASLRSTVTGNEIIPLLGTVSLDISGYDVVKRITAQNSPEFYIERFGTDPDYWEKASPFHALRDKIPPFLAICSLRSDIACIQAEDFIKKAKSLGTDGEVLAVDLSHMEINRELGKEVCYTKKVDNFLKKLSPGIKSMLSGQDTRMKKKLCQ